MPQFDGNYEVMVAFPEASVYFINMSNTPLSYTTFPASKLHPYHKNDLSLFPSCALPQPVPIVTANCKEKWIVECIIDKRRHGRGRQYLVRFADYSQNHDHWIARSDLLDNEALNVLESLNP